MGVFHSQIQHYSSIESTAYPIWKTKIKRIYRMDGKASLWKG